MKREEIEVQSVKVRKCTTCGKTLRTAWKSFFNGTAFCSEACLVEYRKKGE